ncbi:MAG: ribonuclease R [Chlamydiota bacterium]|jgi:ribonuclease R
MNRKKKLYKNLFNTVLQYFLGKKFIPMTFEEIVQKLDIDKGHLSTLRSILKDLLKQGKISLKNKVYSLPSKKKASLLKGTLHLHPRGFGFLEPLDKSYPYREVFIPKPYTNDAVDRDIVEIEVNPEVSAKGPEGKVISIIQRGRTHLAGTVCDFENKTAVVFAPILGSDKKVLLKTSKKVKIGDRVIMQVESWSDEKKNIITKLKKVTGSIDDPSFDIDAIIEEYEIRHLFSKEIKSFVKKIGSSVQKKDLKDRKDFTHLETITIDPETAKDFDDALSLEKDNEGNYLLGVHIADVAHYIEEGSLLDLEAFERANSTYFPGICIPMLPQELSNGLCSLKPNVIRLCQSVLMKIDPDGNIIGYQIVRSYIKSKKRFTYEEAFSIIENKKKSKYAPTLHLMVELCHLLKKQRFQRGSIDFALPEARINVDKKGNPTSITIIEYDISHQLVEEFMLKANEVVATHLSNKNKNVIFRIHDKPSDETMQDFFTLLREYGFIVPKNPNQRQLQDIFLKAKESPYWKEISIAFIKSMKLAFYSQENLGHYGLSLENYCHFTSPIRRYPDLIIQREIFSENSNKVNFAEIATHASNQERKSMKAEQASIMLKKLRLLKSQDPNRIYQATITKIKPFAIFFDIVEFFMESSLHISELKKDFFIYNPKSKTLTGRHTNLTYKCGDQIEIRLVKTDLIRLQSKWEIHKKLRKKK